MKILYLKPAIRDLRKVKDATVSGRIVAGVRALAADDVVALDVVPLAGRPPWRRLRVGDWRVLFRIAPYQGEDTVIVLRAVPRGELEGAVSRLPDVD